MDDVEENMDPGEKGVVHRAGLAMQDLASILSSGSDEEESLQDPSPAPPSVFPSVVSTNLVELNIYLSREEFKELEVCRLRISILCFDSCSY